MGGFIFLFFDFSFLPTNLFSCKSWLDPLIGTGLSNFLLIWMMCTWSKHLRIFTVLECTPPFNTEVVLIYEWQNFCTCHWSFLKLLCFLPNYLLEIWHGCCGKNFLIFVCVKIPLEQLSWVAFSKLFSTVELCLQAWKVDFAENQTSSSPFNQPNVSWVEILRPRDQMAANVQIYPFLAKTSTWVHIVPIS